MASFNGDDLKAVFRMAGFTVDSAFAETAFRSGLSATWGQAQGAVSTTDELLDPSVVDSKDPSTTDELLDPSVMYSGNYEDASLQWMSESGDAKDSIAAQVAASVLVEPPALEVPRGKRREAEATSRIAQRCGVLQLVQTAHAAAAKKKLATGEEEQDPKTAQKTFQEEIRKTVFSKTRICKFHAAGRCRKGTSCPFAHGDEDMRDTPDLSKTSLCACWVRCMCPLSASECRFAHGYDDLKPEAISRKAFDSCTKIPEGRRGSTEDTSSPSMPIAAPPGLVGFNGTTRGYAAGEPAFVKSLFLSDNVDGKRHHREDFGVGFGMGQGLPLPVHPMNSDVRTWRMSF